MLKFSEVKTRDFPDLIETVNQCVAVDKKLTACLGNVKVVFKEALNRLKSFPIQRLQRALLENLLQKNFTKSRRKLINEPADAEVFKTDDIFLRVENLSNLRATWASL